MADPIYTLLFVTVDGKLLTEHGNLTIDAASNAQPIYTVAGGFRGMSPGAPTLTFQVDSAIPAADFEFNPFPALWSMQPVEFGVVGPGGKRIDVQAFITTVNMQHGTNNEAKLSFSLIASPADFE